MSGWTELDPMDFSKYPDLLVPGAWEIMTLDEFGKWCSVAGTHHDYIGFAIDGVKYRVRRPEGWEPKECPTCRSNKKEKRCVIFIIDDDDEARDHYLCTDSWHDEIPISPEDMRSSQEIHGHVNPSKPWPRPEAKQPSHEDDAVQYVESDFCGSIGFSDAIDTIKDTFREMEDRVESEIKRAFIAGRQSADIPPELLT